MPNLPSVTSPLPRDLQVFVQRVREAIDGGGLDGLVTARQMVAAGIASIAQGEVVAPGTVVVEPPRQPTGLAGSGALASVILSWNAPTYSGHAYTEIWAATQTVAQANAGVAPVISQAVLVGMTPGNNFAHTIGSAATRYYWAKNVNQNGTASAFNATAGLAVSTSADPAYLLSLLTDEITDSQLANSLSTRIDLIDASASVANSVNARIQTVSSTVGNNSTSIQTNATSINGVEGKYTVKIDNNGAVAGYGLASTTNASGGIVSEFIVNADRFAIMRGGSDTTAASIPFVVQASATTLNGETVSSGVYMADAFIKNGAITNAKIGDAAIDSAKIANATIVAADISNATITGAKIGNATITGANIASATITNANIANAAINTAKIADAAISLAKINTANITDLSSLAVDAGTITAGVLKSSDNKFVIDLNNKTISIET